MGVGVCVGKLWLSAEDGPFPKRGPWIVGRKTPKTVGRTSSEILGRTLSEIVDTTVAANGRTLLAAMFTVRKP